MIPACLFKETDDKPLSVTLDLPRTCRLHAGILLNAVNPPAVAINFALQFAPMIALW